MRQLFFTAFLFLGLAGSALAQPSDAWLHEHGESIRALFDPLAEEGSFSGIIAVGSGREMLWHRTYGWENREAGVENSPDTRYNMGSITKMMTAVAIGQLVDAGRVSFDATVGTYLPDYPDPTIRDQATVAQLLDHTSGLAGYPFTHGHSTVSGIITEFSSTPPTFGPGTSNAYSNSGFVVAGRIIEVVSGMDYYDYMRQNVFQKAGMASADFLPSTGDLAGRAVPYLLRESDNVRIPSGDMLEPIGSPAGGAYASVADMLAFGDALLDGTLVSPATRDRLFAPRHSMGPGVSYGFGVGVHETNGHTSVGHNGGGPGMSADLRLYPDLGVTTVVFNNFGGRESMRVFRRLENIVTQ